MNWRRGLVRLWLVASALWLVNGFYQRGDDLCTYRYYDAKKEEEWRHNEPLLADISNAMRVFKGDCLPTADNRRVAWDVRQSALAFIVGPPLAALIIGYALLWGVRGFRPSN